VECRFDLDPVHGAAELQGEKHRRPASAGGDVEHARAWTQPEALAEQEEFLLRGRVLDLVLGLRNNEVRWDHPAILSRRG